MNRKPLIAANWKMFLVVDEALKLTEELCAADIDFGAVDVLIAPSFTNLYAVNQVIKAKAKPLILASQNVYTEREGAFTGEVSLDMLKSCGVGAVILGHSERRHVFGEKDSFINTKLHRSLNAGMTAILCIGETLDERISKVAEEVVITQLGKGLRDINTLDGIVIAYEPVWAIGTGMTASPADAQAMHEEIRKFIAKNYGAEAAAKIRILYGGSVKPDNIKELMAQPDIDGVLVGGASLKADQFLKIINH